MYLSAFFIPISSVGWSIANHFVGPRRVRDATQRATDWIADRIGPRKKPILASDMARELCWIRWMQIRPWVACFETACAFSVWLALHGQKSTILLGKHVEKGQLYMHAWLESVGGSFFYDERFAPVFVAAEPYCPTGQ